MATREEPDQFEFESLDLSKFPPKVRLVAEHLRDLFTNFNVGRLREQASMLPQIPDGIGDVEHLQQPAAYSLIAYGIPGLQELYEWSLRDPVEAAHLAGQVLLAVALQDEVRVRLHFYFAHRYLSEGAYRNLVDRMTAACRDRGICSEAKRLVSKLLNHYASDSTRRHDLGMILSGLTFAQKADSPASKLVWEIMATATLQVSEELCNEAADLVQRDLNETEYQNFFELHPALLDPLAASVVPRQALAEMWKTDFVVRRFDDQYVFIELEKPRDPLFTAYPQPSAVLSHALGQVFSWFAWVEDNIAYARDHGFPSIHTPRGLVVIGRDSALVADQRRMLRSMNDLLSHRIFIWTYDELIRNARSVVKNLTSRF